VYDTLIRALAEVDRPGDVCTSGDLPLTMPGLVVEGLGMLRLPLGESQARELVARCRQAPYGKGTQTLVDTAVRRVWELDAKCVQFTNPKWQLLIDSLVGDVQQKLGLESRKLTAHLYKLLVYETGSFFLPHRDGEKLDRMVATLVVVLPSPHEGGALIVSHDGHQHEITFSGAASGYELSYAAFYADCQHEVKPLESGYRLCLIYNVTLAKPRGKKGITAPSYESVVGKISALLASWRNNPDSQKLAILLDHRYTRDGLSLDALKGIDRTQAEVLFEAAERSDCVAHLALITLWQHGTAESDWDEYAYRRDRSYHSWSDFDEDDDEDGDGAGSEYEMGDIFDTSLLAGHWSDRQGEKVIFGEMRLDETEIVTDTALDAGDPSEEDFEDYTGNAGMTLERWYHRAAVVIWPREKHFAVLCEAGTDASIGGLEAMVERLRQASNAHQVAQRQECLTFASNIVDTWESAHGRQSWDKPDKIDRNIFSGLLCELDDPALVRRFLSQILPVDGEIQLDAAFVKLCKRHGWQNIEADLLVIIAAAKVETLIRNAGLLRLLCRQRDKNLERIDLCARLCDGFVDALVTFDNQQRDDDWKIQQLDRAKLLISGADAMLAIDAQSPLTRLINHALNRRNKYKLNDVQLAAIFALEPRFERLVVSNEAVLHWLAACRQLLQNRTAKLPEKPTDYRRADKLSCTCVDCRALSQFLTSPEQREIRMPLNKERRRHLHDVINSDRCDLLHVTERSGRPFTLVCTKTTASYGRASNIYERDLKNLARIIGIEKRVLAK
jgi:hypothetical protein